MNNYITTVNKDYQPKSVLLERAPVPKDSQAIEGSFKQYLKCEGDSEQLTKSEEYVNDYLQNKIVQKYPKVVKKYFSTPVDCPVLEDYNGPTITTYRAHYCKRIKAPEVDHDYVTMRVRDILADFVYPCSTYNMHFRTPRKLDKHLKLRRIIRPINNLNMQSAKYHKTPVSKYTSSIGALGDEIITNHIYGEINS